MGIGQENHCEMFPGQFQELDATNRNNLLAKRGIYQNTITGAYKTDGGLDHEFGE
jgi:hypothetical protein